MGRPRIEVGSPEWVRVEAEARAMVERGETVSVRTLRDRLQGGGSRVIAEVVRLLRAEAEGAVAGATAGGPVAMAAGEGGEAEVTLPVPIQRALAEVTRQVFRFGTETREQVRLDYEARLVALRQEVGVLTGDVEERLALLEEAEAREAALTAELATLHASLRDWRDALAAERGRREAVEQERSAALEQVAEAQAARLEATARAALAEAGREVADRRAAEATALAEALRQAADEARRSAARWEGRAAALEERCEALVATVGAVRRRRQVVATRSGDAKTTD